jgi:NADPH:quinone reductase-like Zn-dependent oxidoreductase
MPDPTAIEKLNSLINAGPFEVQIFRVFPLNQTREAHRALSQHHLGKLALQPTS